MIGKIIFAVASACFLTSLFTGTVAIGEDQILSGVETFFYTLRYGTAGLFGAATAADFVVNFVALVAAAANIVFVFWAMLVFAPTPVTVLKWFWWLSLLFLSAAIYTGIQVVLNDDIALKSGYYLWLVSLLLMLSAPVVSYFERKSIRARNSRARAALDSRSTGNQSAASGKSKTVAAVAEHG